ncbi:MAG TPA: hypothetical protein VFV69_03945 [Steroidobacteraceae bacterium]|jgi:hypothetical protein|nr:hypothetical protein [Steroidobacteraceae bacterium]
MEPHATSGGFGAWLSSQVRPRFQNALLVVYFGAVGIVFVLVTMLLDLVLGERFRWSPRLALNLLTVIAIPVGSIGVGALVSALLWTSDGLDTLKWLRLTLFGATSAFVLGLLAQLRQGPPIDPVFCTLFTLFGAVVLPLIRWLSLKGL